MRESVDCVVIGAGVVGLAVARALALQGREVMVLEAADAIGTGTSSRNSEVIHAGIYYPQGSLKARLCVRGKQLLYAYCEERGLPFKRCGKLIVATSESQRATLESIRLKALANGVDDLLLIDAAQARAMEPALQCVAALHSPSTGIVDSHALMLSLQGDLENAGGLVHFMRACCAPKSRLKASCCIRPTAWSCWRAPSSMRRACTPPAWRKRLTACRQRWCRLPITPRAAISRSPAGRPSRT